MMMLTTNLDDLTQLSEEIGNKTWADKNKGHYLLIDKSNSSSS